MYISPIPQSIYTKKIPSFAAVSINEAFLRQEADTFARQSTERMKNVRVIDRVSEIRSASDKKAASIEKAANDKYENSKGKKGFFQTKDSYQEQCWELRKKINQEKNNQLAQNEQELEKALLANAQECDEVIALQRGENEALRLALSKAGRSVDISRARELMEVTKANSVSLENKGFAKIAGYDNEKMLLYKYFISEIQKERMGQEATVPGSVLFYGPTGMGKTTFYKAFAEEAGCLTDNLFVTPFGPNKDKNFLEQLYKKAEAAKLTFEQTGQRSIIFIDEITKWAGKKSQIIKELTEFMNKCSETYHCTIFAATNFPEKIVLPLKGQNAVFPYRVYLDSPNLEEKAAIIKYYAKDRMSNNTNYMQLAKILTNREKEIDKVFSNSHIEYMINQIKNKNISFDDFVNAVGNMQEGIEPKILEQYVEINKILLENTREV